MLKNKRSAKPAHTLKPMLIMTGVLSSALATAQTSPGVVALTPVEMKWEGQGGLAAAGMEQLNLVGDPNQPGPYTVRLKFPKGLKIAPHSHPDSREVTILSGLYATGYGEKFEPTNLKVLPAGSFYTEPANLPHYIEIKEDAVLQISGTGPSGRRPVNPAK
jgi:quercetin dioxygenase-like cupin family protein